MSNLRILFTMLCVAVCVCLGSPPQELAAQPTQGKRVKKNKSSHKQRVAIASHRLQFEIPSTWTLQEKQGIYIIQSTDRTLLAVLVTLNKPEEIPEAMRELDAFVPVQGAVLGKPTSAVYGSIPIQMMAGRGKMAGSERAVELLSVTLNAVGKPVVGMVYVHTEAAKRHKADLDAWVKSFGVLLTAAEKKKLEDQKK